MSQAVSAAAGTPPHWRVALNPPIYLVSVLPGLGVPLLAADGQRAWLALAFATVAVVLLQHAINLFNDAADWRLGADVEKHDSWVRVHGEQPRVAALHGAVSLLLGGLLGLCVLWLQGQWWILGIAIPMVGLGYLYNAGPRPLSYTHLGEWVTGICYGPGVFGCLWLVSGGLSGSAMFGGAVAFAALAMALLLSHQPPQVDTDRAAGKLSFAVRFGVARTVAVARGLYAVFVLALCAALWLELATPVAPLLATLGLVQLVTLYRAPVSPKRMLLSASAFVVVGLLLRLAGGVL